MSEPDSPDRFHIEQRRAEVSAWFSHGPGGIAVTALAGVLVVLLVLTAVGWF